MLPEPATVYRGLGLMSGTSHDGVDMAACRFWRSDRQWHYAIDAAETLPYDAEWQARLLALTDAPAADLAKTHTDLGHWLGMQVRQFCIRHEVQPQFVASHGHTVFHQPWRHFTHQIGCGETLVTYLDCPLVADFRPRDVARGGEGAPLVPFSQYALFPQVGLCLNLGGVANLSVFAERAGVDAAEQQAVWRKPGWQFLAYDVCAANLVLDHLARQHDPGLRYDPDGTLAAAGEVDFALLQRLHDLDFYHNHPPRSLGREYALQRIFPLLDGWDAPTADKLATYATHVAVQVGRELARFGIRSGDVLVTGGGAHNPYLMARLAEALAEHDVSLAETAPQLVDYAEALHFAFLGLMALLRQPNVLHVATGARSASILGCIHLPERWMQPLL